MTSTISIHDPRCREAAAELLRRHLKLEHEANITSAVRNFLTITGLVESGEITEEIPPGPGSRRAIDLAALNTYIESKRRIGVPAGIAPDPENVRQLDDYLEEAHAKRGVSRMGVLTDGKRWLLRWRGAGAVRTAYPYAFILEDAGQWFALYEWLRDKALSAFENEPPARANIPNHFSSRSPAWEREIADLRILKDAARESPILAETVAVKQRLWQTLLTTALGERSQTPEQLDDLFIRHTYLSIVTGVIVQASFGVDIRRLAETNPADLLRGGTFRDEVGVQGVIESDFFAWPIEVGGEQVIRDIARRAARFDWRSAEADVAAILYETVIPPNERRKLGEYYTPPWLADAMIEEIVADPLEQRALDPSCGSGTFIAALAARFIAAAQRANLPPRETLDRLMESVAGIDVHPVAVHLARSAWALAAKPAIEAVAQEGGDAAVSVPVYLGDSLLLRFRAGDMLAENEVRIPLDDGAKSEIVFPRSLVDRADAFDRLMNDLSRAVESGGDPVGALDAHAMSDDERRVMERAAELMRRLHEEGRNHIWAYYARNLLRPLILTRSKVDILIGNPPWINYRDTFDILRSELERQSKMEYGIWVGGRYATHQDVAGLFFARCVDLYLRDGGLIGFVMPHSALQTGQHAKWRSGEWRSTSGGPGNTRILAVRFSYKTAWDLERLEPNTFFPVPACVAFAERAGEYEKASPLAGQVEQWLGKTDSPDVRRELVPIIDTSARGASPYANRAKQGASIVPRRFFFVEEVESRVIMRALPLITVKPRASGHDKEPWRSLDLDDITEWSYEKSHLFDVHLGETVAPYATLPPLQALLPIKRGETAISVDPNGVGGIRYAAMDERMRRRWRMVSDLWEERKEPTNKLSLLEQLDYRSKLSAQLAWRRNPDDLPIRIVYTSAGRPTAALLSDDHAVVESKLFWVACRNTQEANYLLAVINSDALARDVNKYTTPNWAGNTRDLQKHLWKLPIPQFDPRRRRHAAVADAGKAAAEGAARQLAALQEARPGLTSAVARRELRKWLAESDEGHAVESAVGRLLRGAGA